MTQLSLFDSPTTLFDSPTALADPPIVVVPRRERPSHRPGGQLAAEGATDSLSRLARLIHEGNSRSKAPRSGQVHRIGDLARLALARHDLVAHRRELATRPRDLATPRRNMAAASVTA